MSAHPSHSSRLIQKTDGAAFAAKVGIAAAEQAQVAATIDGMSAKQECRGMFFSGVLAPLGARKDKARAIFDELGLEMPRLPFGLYPHRDFYKLCFFAAQRLYPNTNVAQGMYQLAASFYPIFKQSMVGRTMAPLMGNRPYQVLSRLIDAYRLCVPMNTHELSQPGPSRAVWACKVEPGAMYPDIFRGIVLGTMHAQGVAAPTVELVDCQSLTYGQSCVFSISWE